MTNPDPNAKPVTGQIKYADIQPDDDASQLIVGNAIRSLDEDRRAQRALDDGFGPLGHQRIVTDR